VATAQAPAPEGLRAKAGRVMVGERWTPAHLQQIEDAQRALAHARKDLTLVARNKLGRAAIEPFTELSETTNPGQ